MYCVKLSPYAKMFYNEWLLDPDSSRYNIVMDQTLHGRLDVEKLQRALKRYISTHLILNSHIRDIQGEAYWVENKIVEKLRFINSQINKKDLLNYVRGGFDLFNGPLYRFRLYRIKDKVHRFITVFHHLVISGVSLDAGFFETLSKYYNDENCFPAHTIQEQINLVRHLEKHLNSRLKKNKESYKKFWKEKLHSIEGLDLKFLQFKEERIPGQLSENSISEFQFTFGRSTINKLNLIKKNYNLTPFLYGQMVYAILLYKYTGKNTFGISYPISIVEGAHFMYGAQINTNIMPYELHANSSIFDLMMSSLNFFNQTIKEKNAAGYYPISDILEDHQKEILNVSFIQTNLRNKKLEFLGVRRVKVLSEFSVDSVPENMLLFEQEKNKSELKCRVRYNKNFFDKRLVFIFIKTYKRLFLLILRDLIKNENKKILSYNLLSKPDCNQIIHKLNPVRRKYQNHKLLHELFEDKVAETPNRIAIVYKNKKISYKNLNEKANQVAHNLRQYAILLPDDLIALCLDRNEYRVIAILAVLKAGAAYVPLEPDYPEEKIHHIVSDARIKLIITQAKYHNKFNFHSKVINVLAIELLSCSFSHAKKTNLQTKISGNNLAYAIYTSGTTGKPKGILQPHVNVVRLFQATEDKFHFTRFDIWTLFHSYVFDFSVWEIWGALLYGGKLIIPTSEQIQDPTLFYDLCSNEKITILNQTPTAFYQFIRPACMQFEKKKLGHLRVIILGGEALNILMLRDWVNLYGYEFPALINMYGITETTVHVTYKKLESTDMGPHSLIGKPISDQYVYVLDANLNILPIGAVGELYVGGAGLAREYLNQPKLTNEKFILNPFQKKFEKIRNISSRLYRTGDLVRITPRVELEYIGRIDRQVKIRGYRIELAEIENILLQYPGISQVSVCLKISPGDVGTTYLVAYYVSMDQVDSSNLHEYVLKQLPSYIQPILFVSLDKLPLTTSGKLDTKSLPSPVPASTQSYRAATTKQEKMICQAFASVLKLTKVGIDDDFFSLGGDSISAIRLTTVLQNYFFISVTDIFKFKTPKLIARNTRFDKFALKKRLSMLKASYDINVHLKKSNKLLLRKLTAYFSNCSVFKINYSVKNPIQNVLLTGATGFLGSNILNELLQSTQYKIFLIIRAASKEAALKKVNAIFKFYFKKTLDREPRIVVFAGDIEKKHLGLSLAEYTHLLKNSDAVIHAAALVKHYGDYNQFYSANVLGTVNLLEFTKDARRKFFHYISTASVFYDTDISRQGQPWFTEDDVVEDSSKKANYYLQTKREGEKLVHEYRKHGICSNIYRVGNLAFISKNSHMQRNKEENAFFNRICCLLKLGLIPKELAMEEISPVDLTAQAIVKIFDKTKLNNKIYHVFNPNRFNLEQFFSKYSRFSVSRVTWREFIDCLYGKLNNPMYKPVIDKFLLHEGWLDNSKLLFRNIKIFQARTQIILQQLEFTWPKISDSMFVGYLENELLKHW